MLASRRAAPFTSGVASGRPAAAPRPSVARSGLKLRDAAAMQQRAVSDAALADIADLESRSTAADSGPAGGLPILPSEQVRFFWFMASDLVDSQQSGEESGESRRAERRTIRVFMCGVVLACFLVLQHA